MEFRATKSRINAYHNYKYGEMLTNEIVIGNSLSENEFFLIAREIRHPEKFPNISLNNFNKKGVRVVTIIDNRIEYIQKNFKSESRNRNISIFDENDRIIFKSESIEYTNVYITRISGEFYDERGKRVLITI
jgi:hypothetical protein